MTGTAGSSRSYGTITIYAKTVQHCVSTIGGRHDAAGPCPGATDSGSIRYLVNRLRAMLLPIRRSRQEVVGDNRQEGARNREERNCSDAQDAERQSELRPGNEDRQRSSQARRECLGGSRGCSARIEETLWRERNHCSPTTTSAPRSPNCRPRSAGSRRPRRTRLAGRPAKRARNSWPRTRAKKESSRCRAGCNTRF